MDCGTNMMALITQIWTANMGCGTNMMARITPECALKSPANHLRT